MVCLFYIAFAEQLAAKIVMRLGDVSENVS